MSNNNKKRNLANLSPDWIQRHIWVPIVASIGFVAIIVIAYLAATSRRDDGYVELAQVAQDQDLGKFHF